MGYTRRQIIAAANVGLQLFALAGLVLHSHLASLESLPQPLSSQRISELDDRKVFGWLGNDQLIIGIPEDPLSMGMDHGRASDIFNLKTQTKRPLPSLPTLGSEEDSNRSTPYPSPDGKWLLYTESSYTKDKIIFSRWRLVHPDGSGTQLIPFPAPGDYLSPHWLPDSSGWVGIGSTQDFKRVAYRFAIAGQNLSATRLPVPKHGTLVAITCESELIFNEDRSFRHTAISLNAPGTQPRELDIRHSPLDAHWPGHHGGPWPLAFSQDGKYLFVLGYSTAPQKRIADWLPCFLESPKAGLWRIALHGGAPELLVAGNVTDFSLSPDGTKLLYSQCDFENRATYLLTLPKGK
ncbi:hypothetical protein [Armatimonas rosea]|uniref:Tol biopolymer transport system component n=1 Tax=Armatimonas rosea TaxID=685828 RepID=A0A7W9SN78_ARMRO|nr:hypothetical protein [Armatimonas rosea]MBB6049716.1 Tol biopolymer transport system component [Armatimonas rosea]